ncbi:unnamed protein product, partial [Prorocentrum cordatum]
RCWRGAPSRAARRTRRRCRAAAGAARSWGPAPRSSLGAAGEPPRGAPRRHGAWRARGWRRPRGPPAAGQRPATAHRAPGGHAPAGPGPAAPLPRGARPRAAAAARRGGQGAEAGAAGQRDAGPVPLRGRGVTGCVERVAAEVAGGCPGGPVTGPPPPRGLGDKYATQAGVRKRRRNGVDAKDGQAGEWRRSRQPNLGFVLIILALRPLGQVSSGPGALRRGSGTEG